MQKWWQKITQNSANQSAASGSTSYWLGSAVVALGGGGYITYKLWPDHQVGAIIAALVFLLVGVYDLRLVLAKRAATRKRR